MQAQPEEIKKSHTTEVESIDTLKEKLKALKMSDFPFHKGFIPQYKENELDMMESLLIEKFCDNKEFKHIENIIFKNSDILVDIYLPEYINNPIYIEKQSPTLKSIGFIIFLVSTIVVSAPILIYTNFLYLRKFIPDFLYNTPENFSVIFLLLGFFIFLKNSSLTFSKLTGFLYSFLSVVIPGLYNKFKLAKKLSKKLSTEDMIKVTKLFIREHVSYSQNYLLKVGKEKDVNNLSIGVEKIIKNIEDCFEKIEIEKNNHTSSIFIYCLTLIEYGLMIKYTCNNYDRYLNYQNEVSNIENKISQKIKADNNLENIYKKL